MNAENLGNVVAKPQPNEKGSLVYYETDKGFGVHIDATSGKLLQVRHKDTGARVYVDGIETYGEPEEAPVEGIEELVKKAFYDNKRILIRYLWGEYFSGRLVSLVETSVGIIDAEMLTDGGNYKSFNVIDIEEAKLLDE